MGFQKEKEPRGLARDGFIRRVVLFVGGVGSRDCLLALGERGFLGLGGWGPEVRGRRNSGGRLVTVV